MSSPPHNTAADLPDLEQPPHAPFANPSHAGSRESVQKGAPLAGSPPPHAAAGPSAGAAKKSPTNKRKILIAAALAALAVLVLVIVLPVYFVVVKPKNQAVVSSGGDPVTGNGNTGGGGGGDGGGGTTSPSSNVATGGDGSLVTTEDGSTFTYTNKFGGYWYYDSSKPFNSGARAQGDVPPLNQTWKWGDDVISGVNIGGWLVLEPFITPALFQKYPGAVDEYTLSTLMRADAAGGGINQIEDHYKTFFTEKDFADIAAAGLNWVRLPIPYWAIETFEGEPFLANVAWKYALKGFEWARKYGLRIKLDLHAAPGSQNPWWHSGRAGTPHVLVGAMGYANAQRTLDYIRIITEFISQDQYKDLIPLFGVLNEPLLMTLTRPEVERFYYQAHQTVRAVTGLGAGNGPYISFHDGFDGVENWAGFLPGADRMVLDHHPYFAFSGGSTDPFAAFITRACDSWAAQTNTSMTAFGMTVAGEWSMAWNDCGLYVNGVNGVVSYPGDCTVWDNWETWTQDVKDQMKLFALNQMDALQSSFFWTWKIAPTSAGVIRAPLWSYKLGLDNGWMPTNPREARGVCASTNPFKATSFQSWQVGGAGAGTFLGSVAAFTTWPPPAAQYLFTPNRPIPKLPSNSDLNKNGIDVGDGWTNDADTTLAMGPNPGCTYPNAWEEGGGPAVPECTAGGV